MTGCVDQKFLFDTFHINVLLSFSIDNLDKICITEIASALTIRAQPKMYVLAEFVNIIHQLANLCVCGAFRKGVNALCC